MTRNYSSPQLFRIELNQEQAILSACSLATTAAFNGRNAVAIRRSFRAANIRQPRKQFATFILAQP